MASEAFQVLTMVPPPTPTPSKVRRWIKGSHLGAGSFGTVNLAINMDNGALLAVKSMQRIPGRTTQKQVDAMENEIRILQALDSRHIIKYLGSDYTYTSQNGGCLVRNLLLEYIPGGSLVDLMKKFGGKLDEDLVRLYTKGILQGLEYLHAKGIVHCDIKGKNILVGGEGESVVKIADFGSAIMAPVSSPTISSDKLQEIRGTPLWMAPEVVHQIEQTAASDIWSLGCTVLEMITGNPPWIGDSGNCMAALFKIGCSKETPSFPAGISKVAGDFLLCCFQRDPRSRSTASQLLSHPFIRKSGGGSGRNDHGYGNSLSVASEAAEPNSPTSILDLTGHSHSWTLVPSSTLHQQQQGRNEQSEAGSHPPQQDTDKSCAADVACHSNETGVEDMVSHVDSTDPATAPSEPCIDEMAHDGVAFQQVGSVTPPANQSEVNGAASQVGQAALHSQAGGEGVAWIVVRGDRSNPYTPPPQVEKPLMTVKKGSEVDLGCLNFLRKRRRGNTTD